MKTFLFVSIEPMQSEDFSNFLNLQQDIRNWYRLGGTYAFLGLCEVDHYQGVIAKAFPDMKFVITEIYPSSIGGFMPKAFWEFVGDPKDSGFHPPFPS